MARVLGKIGQNAKKNETLSFVFTLNSTAKTSQSFEKVGLARFFLFENLPVSPRVMRDFIVVRGVLPAIKGKRFTCGMSSRTRFKLALCLQWQRRFSNRLARARSENQQVALFLEAPAVTVPTQGCKELTCCRRRGKVTSACRSLRRGIAKRRDHLGAV